MRLGESLLPIKNIVEDLAGSVVKLFTIAVPAVRARRRRQLFVGSVSACAVLGGCAVGPNFHSPPPPPSEHYTPAPEPQVTAEAPTRGGAAQRFVTGRDIPADWWSLFESAPLDELVRRSLRDSPTIDAAKASLRSAQATYLAERGALLLPLVDAQAGVTRERVPGAAFGQPGVPASVFTLYNASVAVSYRLDLFGASRRQVESLRAQADYQRWELEAANLTLTGNVVTTAIAAASLRAQIAAVNDIVRSEQEQLRVVEKQFDAGAAARADVLSQRAQLAQAQAVLPDLEKVLAASGHRLAVLTGRTPDTGDLPEFTFDGLTLPTELPLSVPAKLVLQRPDIQAAEALVHQASAALGVATANLFPQITLTGMIGSESVTAGDLFGPGSGTWNAGASLLQPLFHGGELRYKRQAAVADLDRALASYRETVLEALQQVADTLRALEADARSLRAQLESERAASDALDIAQKQFHAGGISYVTVLNAQRQYLQARQSRAQAQGARYADSAALVQALGGGWWNRKKEE
ncbi:MAG TPA: efflux transporter outer membrane subunit [Steroidobacteraceae bacterium]|nr:efflux transporter outer membrane subunit [Steroidobacteraceae bacterium]